MQAKPKIAIREPVPEKLVARMNAVANLIEAGAESTTIESDDLIQFDGVWDCVGGLTNTETGQFFFCFYVGDEDDTTQWMLDLSQSEIKAIADGTLTSLELWRCAHCVGADRFSGPDGYCRECDRP